MTSSVRRLRVHSLPRSLLTLPESAAALEDALAKAKAKDEAIAAAAQGATYAGEEDPYRHDDEEGEADEKDWA